MSDEEAPPAPAPADSPAPEGPPDDGSGDAGPPPIIPTEKHPDLYLPIYVMTGIYGAIFIIVPLLIRKGPNQGLIRCCIWIATFSMWIFWFTVYVSQMNPLVGPRVKNTTLAWLAQAWGDEAVPPAVSDGGDGGGGGDDSPPPPPPPPGDDGEEGL